MPGWGGGSAQETRPAPYESRCLGGPGGLSRCLGGPGGLSRCLGGPGWTAAQPGSAPGPPAGPGRMPDHGDLPPRIARPGRAGAASRPGTADGAAQTFLQLPNFSAAGSLETHPSHAAERRPSQKGCRPGARCGGVDQAALGGRGPPGGRGGEPLLERRQQVPGHRAGRPRGSGGTRAAGDGTGAKKGTAGRGLRGRRRVSHPRCVPGAETASGTGHRIRHRSTARTRAGADAAGSGRSRSPACRRSRSRSGPG